jgi:hypothetical protein
MNYKLGSTVQTGEKIKTSKGWRKIISVLETGVTIKGDFISFGETIYGWKAKHIASKK